MRLAFLAAAVSLMLITTSAQAPAPQSAGISRPPIAFDVASVKRYGGQAGFQTMAGGPRILPGGVLRATSTTVLALIKFAYHTSLNALTGGPDWIGSELFVVEGRAPDGTPPDRMRQMLQSLLENRFVLETHYEQREMSFFALTLAHSDDRVGPYMVRVTTDCDADTRKDAFNRMPARPERSEGINTQFCGAMDTIRDAVEFGVRELVVDRTGLTGQFAINVHADNDPGVRDSAFANFPAALLEQTGLKVEAMRGLVDVLVIDSARQPTSN